MRRSAIALIAAALAAPVAGCGGEEEVRDNAVEAREQNIVELGGVRYRVLIFRELNVHAAPDDALWEGDPPDRGRGLYMVALEACATDGDARLTDEIHLEDAFGQRFAPRRAATAPAFAYEPRTLEEGACVPRVDSPADETFGGEALVFEVPFDATRERPMILELGAPEGSATARVELDL